MLLLMPNKYINLSESYIGAGGVILSLINKGKRIEDLWSEYNKKSEIKKYSSVSFRDFLQTLNFLFAINVIEFKENGVISKCI